MIDSDIKYSDGAFSPRASRRAERDEDGIYCVWTVGGRQWVCTEPIGEGNYLDPDYVYKRLDWAAAPACPERVVDAPIAPGWYLIEDSGGHEHRVQYKGGGLWYSRYGVRVDPPKYRSIRPIELGEALK